MSWNIDDARELYGVQRWGNGYFDINTDGDAVVQLRDGDSTVPVSLQKIIEGLADRGSAMPQLLRFRDLLDRRIEDLNESFLIAIKETSTP